jgi:hypothetical protein
MKRTRASLVVLLWGTALAMDAAAQEIVGDPSSSLVYTPVTPCRVVDTRRNGDPGEVGALQVGERRQWDVRGFNFAFQGGDSNCGELKEPQGRAYALSITAVGFANNGSVKVFEANAAPPAGNTLVYFKGAQKSITTSAIVRVCGSCVDQIEANVSGSATHLAIDVVGYFDQAVLPDPPPPPPPPPTLVPVTVVSGGCSTVGVTNPFDGSVESPACPVGFLLVGGECTAGNGVMRLFQSTRSGDRWHCAARNTFAGPGTYTSPLSACSICLRTPVTVAAN